MYFYISKKKIKTLEGENDTTSLICRLLVAFGESFTIQIGKNIMEPAINTFLDMLLECTQYPGYLPAEQELSDLPLYFWFVLSESFQERSELSPQLKKHFISLFSHLVPVLTNKLRFPFFDIWTTWPEGKPFFSIFL